MASMITFPEYIHQTGDDEVAKILNKGRRPKERVTARTVMSWRLRTRFPTKDEADEIVKRCQMTYEGIYSVERKRDTVA